MITPIVDPKSKCIRLTNDKEGNWKLKPMEAYKLIGELQRALFDLSHLTHERIDHGLSPEH